MSKRSGGLTGLCEGWAKLYGLKEPSGDLFCSEGSDGAHSVPVADPSRDGSLVNAERLPGFHLGSEVLDETLVNVHAESSNGNTHMLGHGNTALQEDRVPRNDYPMEFKDRLKAARKYADLKQGELAALAGMTQTSISDLERGKSASTSFTSRIAKACGVDPLWLETGAGDMLSKERFHPEDKSDTNLHSLQIQEASLVQAADISTVPLISWVAAGNWCEAVDLFSAGDAEVWMPCPDRIGPRGYALRVEGESMTSPYPGTESYPHGTVIYVDPDIAYKNGDAVVAKLPDSNEATFKILVEDAGRVYLRPLNPQFPMIPITRETHICGVVVGAYHSRR